MAASACTLYVTACASYCITASAVRYSMCLILHNSISCTLQHVPHTVYSGVVVFGVVEYGVVEYNSIQFEVVEYGGVSLIRCRCTIRLYSMQYTLCEVETGEVSLGRQSIK